MKVNTVGDYFRENVLIENPDQPGTGYLWNSGDPFEIITPSLDNVDGIGLVICVADASRVITANGDTDNVDASSHTWVFEEGSFGQGDVGATFVIANSAEGNNGTYTIDTVVDENTVTSTEAPAADETFADDVTMTLTDLPMQATCTFEVSNDYAKQGEPNLNQTVGDGHWADITSGFSPAFEDIVSAGCQYSQAYPLVARRGKLIITPTAGASLVSVYYSAKGNR